jgi:hypothetical protein
MFQLLFVDTDTVKGHAAAFHNQTGFQDPERPEGGPIDGDTHLLEVLGHMGEQGGSGGPGIDLGILHQAMRAFELAPKAFLGIDDGDATAHAR